VTNGWQTFSTDEEFPTGPVVLKGDVLLETGFQEGPNLDVLEILSEVLGSRKRDQIAAAPELEGALVHFHGRRLRRVAVWLYPKEGHIRMIEAFATEDARTMALATKTASSGYK
jgi:hypothetical protein